MVMPPSVMVEKVYIETLMFVLDLWSCMYHSEMCLAHRCALLASMHGS